MSKSRTLYTLKAGLNQGNVIYVKKSELPVIKKYEKFLKYIPNMLSLHNRGRPKYSEKDEKYIKADPELLAYVKRLGVQLDE